MRLTGSREMRFLVGVLFVIVAVFHVIVAKPSPISLRAEVLL